MKYKKGNITSERIFRHGYLKRLLPLITLISLAISNSSLSVANEVEDITVKGNFTTPLSLQKIRNKILITDDVLEKKLVLFISGKEVYKSEAHTKIEYIGQCYDRETKLQQLIYFEWNGGASDVGEIAFIHYNQSKRLFKSDKFINRDESFIQSYKQKKSIGLVVFKNNKAICNWKEKRIQKAAATRIFHAIRATKKPTLVINGDNTLDIKKLNKQLITKFKANIEIKTEIIFNNEKWKVVNVESKSYEYQKKGWNSWGALIAEEKGTNNIFSFYNTPPGDSHKAIIYSPENLQCDAQKQSNSKLCLSLCTECSWWGQYGSFLIDLEKQTIKRIKK